VEETVAPPQMMQLSYIFRKCSGLLGQLCLEYQTSTWLPSEIYLTTLFTANTQNDATDNEKRELV
jgi:hypothetical protein